MLVAERCEKILRLVRTGGSVRVSELSTICNVTEETIRRDLARLEKEGKLKRSHGGAVAINDPMLEEPYSEREVKHVAEKIQIARKAIEFVENRDFIILDASTTARYMASELPNMRLTVLTNSLRVVLELSSKRRIKVISTGGTLRSRTMAFVGPLAEKALDQYHVNKAFLSCQGIHLDRGVSETNELQARIKQKMTEISDQVFMLVDSSKFGLQSFAHVAPMNNIDYLITDERAETFNLDTPAHDSLKIMRVSL